MMFKKKADYDIRVGEIIRIYRKRAGMTQGELAKIVGVSTATIANYENGATVPDVRKVDIIGDVLGIPNIMSFCEPSEEIWLNLYSVGDKIEITDDGHILCQRGKISADIFKLYNCTKICFACMEQNGCIYFLVDSDNIEPGDRALVQFSDEKELVFADFDGEFYTDIKTNRRENNVLAIVAKVLGIIESFKKSKDIEHKYEISLI